MWRERALFFGVGVLASALVATTWHARPAADGDVAEPDAAAARAAAARIAELERRVEELEGRPPATSLARPPPPPPPPRSSAPDSRPLAGPEPADPGIEGTDGAAGAPAEGLGPGRVARTPVSYPRLIFGNGGDVGAVPVGSEAILPADEVERALRSGTDEARAKAFEALRKATSKEHREVAERALPEARDEAETRRLIDAIARLKDRAWSALQATGAPDTPIAGDLATAWASRSGDMGEVTLDLTYDRAVRVDRVRIHETYHPGAVARIYAKNPDGAWDLLWEGRAPAVDAPTWFAPPLAGTAYATTAIRLVLDTDRVPDWNEIDAVELEGDGLRQWASGATASSSYADAR